MAAADVPELLDTLRCSPDALLREAAALSLCGIAASEAGQIEIRRWGGLPLMVGQLPRLVAAQTLKRLACEIDNEDGIREAGGVVALVALVADAGAPTEAREAACGALQNLASEDNPENQAAIRECGGLEALTLFLGAVGGSRAAADALRNLRTDATNAAALDALAASGHFPGAARDSCDYGRRMLALPANWDPSVRFTDRYLHPGLLDDESWAIHSALHAPPSVNTAVRIEDITRVDHPCVGQRGLFAAEALCVGTRLCRYCGVAKARTAGDAGEYLFAVKSVSTGELKIDIDAGPAGNESRYINDYHNTGAEQPNVQFAEGRGETGELEVWVEILRPIAEGEEILVSYGKHFF